MRIDYVTYYEKVLGGWIGKSIGGAIGARFEGNKNWIEITSDELFPETIPFNDDLDLQVLWLKVLEEKGDNLTSADLADAWLEGCWYPANEYGIFRHNWMRAIHPPESGKFNNQFWETGMGCPIRSEIWGYVFAGNPDRAARFAQMDGVLDHTDQAVGAEMMFSVMASMAFWISDVRVLSQMFWHYLPKGTEVERLSALAFKCFDKGLSLKQARQQIILTSGNPEACDSRINVPFIFLGLLYGNNDLEETLIACLKCGYDTDCTMATSGALIGQILGASKIPDNLKKPIGNDLVMGMQYKRPEMTLSALARDTVRVGTLISRSPSSLVTITDAPIKETPSFKPTDYPYNVTYENLPAAGPGQQVILTIAFSNIKESTDCFVQPPEGWQVLPQTTRLCPGNTSLRITAKLDERVTTVSHTNIFYCKDKNNKELARFGLCGVAIWKILGVFYDIEPYSDEKKHRKINHHFVEISREYLDKKKIDEQVLYQEMSAQLGKPALIYAPEHLVDITRVIGLQGPYCVYLSRTIVCPEDREAIIVVGNNDAYSLKINGQMIATRDEYTHWCPFNDSYQVNLKKGPNKILVKLIKRGELLRFSFGIRNAKSPYDEWPDAQYWMTDLADMV